jgi:hypothetical protein
MLGHTAFFILVALAGAHLAVGQSILDGLSTSCTTALKSVLLSPDAGCLNPGTLLSASLQSNISVPNMVDTWLKDLCSIGSCSNSTIETIVKNVTSGCSDDLSSFGISVDTQTVIDYSQQFYQPVRQMACLKDDSANQLCATQTLNNLEGVVGQLSVDDLSWDILQARLQQLLAANLPNLACTGCMKEAYTIASSAFPFPGLISQLDGPITQVCGPSFIDQQDVASISKTAVSTMFLSQPSGNGGPSTSGVAIGIVLLSTFSVLGALL